MKTLQNSFRFSSRIKLCRSRSSKGPIGKESIEFLLDAGEPFIIKSPLLLRPTTRLQEKARDRGGEHPDEPDTDDHQGDGDQPPFTSDWRYVPIPDLDHWIRAGFGGQPSPITEDELAAKSLADAAVYLNEYEPDTQIFDGPDRSGLLTIFARTAGGAFPWAFGIADELANRALWPRDVWASLLRVWRAGTLSNTSAGDDPMRVAIKVGGIRDRMLVVDDPRRFGIPRGDRVAAIDVFPIEGQYSRAELLTNAGGLAVAAARAMFQRFNWDLPAERLTEWLESLRSQR
jgi:hypothetical protein